MRLLLVEDDRVLSSAVSEALRSSFAVDCCRTVGAAQEALSACEYDIVLLDLGLKDGDGLDVLRGLRSRGSNVPVLIVTARDTLDDRVTGLDSGADDYLTKPFELAELEARIRALLRRKFLSSRSEIEIGNLRFDSKARQVFVDGKLIDLSGREVSVLELLLVNLGRVVNKDQIVEKIFRDGEEVGPNAIEVYMHRLRKKISPEGFSIRTIRGLGYILQKAS